jgi:hypothetical protein
MEEIDLDKTVWRGMEILHPREWALVSASPWGKPGACVFADRRNERFKVQWRAMKTAPNLAKLIEEKPPRDDRPGPVPLKGQPPAWRGTLERAEGGTIVHAGRHFAEEGLFTEAVLLWPGRRDRPLENALLQGVRPAVNDTEGRCVWRAMGLFVRVASSRDLLRFRMDEGQTSWGFGPRGVKAAHPDLGLRRIAMPWRWLHTPLDAWLQTQLEPGWRLRLARRTFHNNHTAARIVSFRRGRMRHALAGRVLLRVDLAWHCDVEDRVYHVQYQKETAEHDLSLPADLTVECCAPYIPPVIENRSQRGSRRSRESAVADLDVKDLLGAIPFVNRSAKIMAGSRGGAMAEVPLRQPWYLAGPVRWIFPVSKIRRVKLDIPGASLLDLCDGTRNIEQVVETFATRNRLTFAEARKPVMDYLRYLSRRGIVAVAGMKDGHEGI